MRTYKKLMDMEDQKSPGPEQVLATMLKTDRLQNGWD